MKSRPYIMFFAGVALILFLAWMTRRNTTPSDSTFLIPDQRPANQVVEHNAVPIPYPSTDNVVYPAPASYSAPYSTPYSDTQSGPFLDDDDIEFL